MVVLKALTLAAVALLTLFLMLFIVRQTEAVKARVRSRPPRRPSLRRLRQDPRTGVYYPED
ncbi:hypothetical protein [Aestuariivirga sp.]|jgi:hypothetical protein|uniref:hypothetical protein n=1 Tax=Aestuariivirga sp. TaxID=2650926 RepID=UPI0037843874